MFYNLMNTVTHIKQESTTHSDKESWRWKATIYSLSFVNRCVFYIHIKFVDCNSPCGGNIIIYHGIAFKFYRWSIRDISHWRSCKSFLLIFCILSDKFNALIRIWYSRCLKKKLKKMKSMKRNCISQFASISSTDIVSFFVFVFVFFGFIFLFRCFCVCICKEQHNRFKCSEEKNGK